MKQTWRGFGSDDPVLLPHVRQAGASGIVSALHHMNRGQAWTDEEVLKRKAEIEAHGLAWDAVESIAVPEDIKTRGGNFRAQIENYKASIRAIGRAGINTACHVFMAITDWTRTDLMWPLANSGSALRFDMVDFCDYDVLILKRRGAEADHPDERIDEARARLAAWPDSKIAELERSLIDWVPARETICDRTSFNRRLDGETDMVGVVAALLDEEARRGGLGHDDAQIRMRPDHGHLIVDDIGKPVNSGYSCIGRLKGLAELRGVMRTVARFRAGTVH